jgi:hypothetical protein
LADRERGIAEMKRVTRGPCVILTWERPSDAFWLTSDYLPHFLEADRKIFPPWFRERACEVRIVPIPHDCADDFFAPIGGGRKLISITACAAPFRRFRAWEISRRAWSGCGASSKTGRGVASMDICSTRQNAISDIGW